MRLTHASPLFFSSALLSHPPSLSPCLTSLSGSLLPSLSLLYDSPLFLPFSSYVFSPFTFLHLSYVPYFSFSFSLSLSTTFPPHFFPFSFPLFSPLSLSPSPSTSLLPLPPSSPSSHCLPPPSLTPLTQFSRCAMVTSPLNPLPAFPPVLLPPYTVIFPLSFPSFIRHLYSVSQYLILLLFSLLFRLLLFFLCLFLFFILSFSLSIYFSSFLSSFLLSSSLSFILSHFLFSFFTLFLFLFFHFAI